MLHQVGIVFLLTWTSVFGENCIKYDFESDYDIVFHNNETTCEDTEPWYLGKYESDRIIGVPSGSDHYIEPKTLSCGSSYSFHLGAGILEVNVFMHSKSEKDQVSVLVKEIEQDGRLAVRGTAHIQPSSPNYVDGWNVLRITLPTVFTGHLTFLGAKDEESIVLIDSFRFYKFGYEPQCKIYESELDHPTTVANIEEIESTTEISTDTESETTEPDQDIDTTSEPELIPTTTKSPERLEECVTYNFDNDFESLFTDQHNLCSGFTTWSLGKYSDAGIDTVNAKGTNYLKPNEDLSCISAFPIRMSPNGTVEINVYIDPVTAMDHIIVLVKQLVAGGTDTVAGFYIYEPSINNFARGWNVLRISVSNLRSFDGYLLFLGISSEGATVLVDSFRYIPPSMSADDVSCAY